MREFNPAIGEKEFEKKADLISSPPFLLGFRTVLPDNIFLHCEAE